MKPTDKLTRLKEEFNQQYPYAELKIQRRKYNGRKHLYFTTIGCYKVESGRLISLYFPRIQLIRSDYAKLTYVYRNQ
jgi:hypothetical protein